MKICWDNLEKLEYRHDRGEWQDKKWKSVFYIYKESCQNCGEPFLAQTKNRNSYCTHNCSNSGKYHPNYNKKHPHISKKMLGKNNPAKRPEVKKKISKKLKELYNNYPEKHSSSNSIYLKKLQKRMLGENNPAKRPEVKKKISEAISGENHPNWKGGISCEPYCDVWLDKDFKESIKERDGYQCLNPTCSRESKKLCIHHINYIKKDCSPFNLITVCNSCNTKANFDRVWHQLWYTTIIKKRYGDKKVWQ